MFSIKLKGRRLYYLDQTKLPFEEVYYECKGIKDGLHALNNLKIRGAPLIGVFSAYCVYIEVKKAKNKEEFFSLFSSTLHKLRNSRPTAFNLFKALTKLESVVNQNKNSNLRELKDILWQEICSIHREDIELCRKMSEFGAELIRGKEGVLTHCNTGALATTGIGTALGVIITAYRRYKNINIYVDETRPLLQGSRLTCWELEKSKVPYKLICDNMAGYLMSQGRVNKVFVGADRITLRGDVANKIGTYTLAVLAKYHSVPFYVVAPSTTFDLSIKDKQDVPIEERKPEEVKKVLNKLWIAPYNAEVYNPAFDITPNHLITGIITEKGIIMPPFYQNIRRVIKYE